ncbi:HK97 family phage prohead protease [Bacteroidota bacterium]
MDNKKEILQGSIKEIEKEDRIIKSYVVTNKINRYNRKINPKGIKTDNYSKSPVVLWMHDLEKVIGKNIWLKADADGMIAKTQFRDSGLANEIYHLYKEKYLTSWSVSFTPLSFDWIMVDGKDVIDVKECELLEYSAVSIPADPDAVSLVLKQGIVKNDILYKCLDQELKKV